MNRKGFTLIELVIVIVILGILAAVAIPRYFDLVGNARESACKGALGGVRSATSIWRAANAAGNAGAPTTWPTLVNVNETGVNTGSAIMENGDLPDNPYSTSADKDVVVAGVTRGTPVTAGTTGGWCYKAATGEFWADTASGAGEANW